jgi:hypothetical protein
MEPGTTPVRHQTQIEKSVFVLKKQEKLKVQDPHE